jgi:hypothetical protein
MIREPLTAKERRMPMALLAKLTNVNNELSRPAGARGRGVLA